MSLGRWREGHPHPLTVTVGPEPGADVRGDTNVALQAAVDYLAGVGGGTVRVQPGAYTMHDSLHLRSHVSVEGAGEDTVLWKPPCVRSPLTTDLFAGHWEVYLTHPDDFRPGMGVYIHPDRVAGFTTTVATLLYRDGERFGLSKSLQDDYWLGSDPEVVSVYPLVSGCEVSDARVSGLHLEGNADENVFLNGCRGGGIYLLGGSDLLFTDLTIRDFNGDGFSFQQTYDVTLEDVRSLDNRGHGFHPGSGTERPVMRRLLGRGNHECGLFFCVCVKHGVAEDSEFAENYDAGVYFNRRDTDDTLQRLRIHHNGNAGIHFRPLAAHSAAHRTQILDSVIEYNCQREGRAELEFNSAIEDTLVKDCRVRPAEGKAGVYLAPEVVSVDFEDVEIEAPSELAFLDERDSRLA